MTINNAIQNHQWGLHWFRRDLRLEDNLAFIQNYQRNEGRVLGFFCFDPTFLSRQDFSHNRFAFFLQTLKELKTQLLSLEGDLIILEGRPQEAFKKLFEFLQSRKVSLPQNITFNRDYEPFARKRDLELFKYFSEDLKIKVETFRDHLILEPGEVLKDEEIPQSFYSVYTAFYKKWIKVIIQPEKNLRIFHQIPKTKLNLKLTWKNLLGDDVSRLDCLEHYIKNNLAQVSIDLNNMPEAGHHAALNKLKKFKDKLKNYQTDRDLPSILGTSQISPYLKNGSITSAQIIFWLEKNWEKFDLNQDVNKLYELQFLKELVWREFFYHILWFRPEVESAAFNIKFKNISWENNQKKFDAWKLGITGYPIVDAGMRELNQTGNMHNRVRMITASFLIKDLHVDWRWGEKYFMEKLWDGDLAVNNGNWQWVAGTGCDAAPYFRIFNPMTQGKRFDPDAVYIKKYIPELTHVSSKDIHLLNFKVSGYPSPIVNHDQARLKTMELYKT